MAEDVRGGVQSPEVRACVEWLRERRRNVRGVVHDALREVVDRAGEPCKAETLLELEERLTREYVVILEGRPIG